MIGLISETNNLQTIKDPLSIMNVIYFKLKTSIQTHATITFLSWEEFHMYILLKNYQCRCLDLRETLVF